ncbi:MAG: hypothetical protein EX254_05670 [Flavobacteriaceae bacterium]|nr:hypothetical protein [Flavobacteriaceae bacterium]RZV65420.1 MAG: hypothetical protein EX254_05670 [Flavobacteriaceae bacterium]
MKKTGIWIDKDTAHIVTIENETETVKTINSEVEHFRIHGGYGGRAKGGPQDVVQDSKYLEREKHQLKAYFKEIANEIKNSDELVVFGPAETGEKFRKELQERYADIGKKLKEVKKADSMTDNQVKAWVRNYFN